MQSLLSSVIHLPFTPHCLTRISSGIKAEVLVVESFEELKRRAGEAVGRIVVFNQPFVSYGETVAYRAYGASEAAKVGAVATLIRSITPFSINRYLSIYLSTRNIYENYFEILLKGRLVWHLILNLSGVITA